jgi:hypothetical protein
MMARGRSREEDFTGVKKICRSILKISGPTVMEARITRIPSAIVKIEGF